MIEDPATRVHAVRDAIRTGFANTPVVDRNGQPQSTGTDAGVVDLASTAVGATPPTEAVPAPSRPQPDPSQGQQGTPPLPDGSTLDRIRRQALKNLS